MSRWTWSRWTPDSEPLAEGVHAGHALLQVAAGPDVAEAGHASMLRFIRTGRNRKVTPAGCAEQRGGLAEVLAGAMRAWRMLALVGQRGPGCDGSPVFDTRLYA